MSDPEKLRARRTRYDRSEKGQARHERYNHSEKGRARWLRYEEGMVGITHRLADSMRKRRARSERDREKVLALGEGFDSLFVGDAMREYLAIPLPDLPEPNYNRARKTDAICAKRRELGWDWKSDGFLGPATMQPIRGDAAPPRVVKRSVRPLAYAAR